MPSPYRPEEIANTILRSGLTGASGRTLVDVSADEVLQVWLIRVRESGPVICRYVVPFSMPREICTPAEIALLLREDRWPFQESS